MEVPKEKSTKISIFQRIRRKIGLRGAIDVASEAGEELKKTKEPGKKSLLISGLASTCLGPFGWFYAGSFRDALIAGSIYGVTGWLLSKTFLSFMLIPALTFAMPLSGLTGLYYAWQYNRKGQRIRLLGAGDKQEES